MQAVHGMFSSGYCSALPCPELAGHLGLLPCNIRFLAGCVGTSPKEYLPALVESQSSTCSSKRSFYSATKQDIYLPFYIEWKISLHLPQLCHVLSWLAIWASFLATFVSWLGALAHLPRSICLPLLSDKVLHAAVSVVFIAQPSRTHIFHFI